MTAVDQERVARPRPDAGPERAVWDAAASVVDPEVPVLSIEDLGVLRAARLVAGVPVVDITPTYSGCPAVDAIRDDIVAVLAERGFPGARVRVVLSPAWTTDWMSDEGRRKLAEHGIAPPGRRAGGVVSVGLGVRCPRCRSLHTRQLARFGSTSCKALYVCQRCREPFDHFKEH
ncbi:1,2-phenylacetyl-CoA epoxidase subunit PaaD [Promicromonospora sp. NPDC057138]|uniref:1,2-phenylacetyl-CoA epoxidase subunit PaaD n=1 Tax=Promicromonospora sp. NPDC057138 TaxID=3346031 RepID=UPI00363D5362